MKKTIMILLASAVCAFANAQNEWEEMDRQQEQKELPKSERSNPDSKYLAGAVPLVAGRVAFAADIAAPGKSAAEIFNAIKAYMERLTRQPNQLEHSTVALADEQNRQLVGSYQEWLVFKSNALVLDRTRFYYTLRVDCADGMAKVVMSRIYYFYDEERNPVTYRAEEWIDDANGLNSKKNKLARLSGKFRRKTIDRKDYLFAKLDEILNGKTKDKLNDVK